MDVALAREKINDCTDTRYMALCDFLHRRFKHGDGRSLRCAFSAFELERGRDCIEEAIKILTSADPARIQETLVHAIYCLLEYWNKAKDPHWMASFCKWSGAERSEARVCLQSLVSRSTNICLWILSCEAVRVAGFRNDRIARDCVRLASGKLDTDAANTIADRINEFVLLLENTPVIQVCETAPPLVIARPSVPQPEHTAQPAGTRAAERPYWYVFGLPDSLKNLAEVLQGYGTTVDAYTLKGNLGEDPSRLIGRLKNKEWKEWTAKFIARPKQGRWRLRTEDEVSKRRN